MTSPVPARWRRRAELVVHLARREATSANRLTLLGWAWPLVRLLAQLGVLVLVFSTFLDVPVDDFPLFVFCGLIVWNWFSTALAAGTRSLLSGRHLVMQPGFPAAALPAVAVVVPLIDLVLTLPILVVLLALEGHLGPKALLLPAILAVELVLLCGLAWLAASVTVFLRDIPNVVAVALTLLFYVTPVFYDRGIVPEDFEWVLDLNPVAFLVEAARAVLLDRPAPPVLQIVAVTVFSLAVAVGGLLVFRRLQPRLPDEL